MRSSLLLLAVALMGCSTEKAAPDSDTFEIKTGPITVPAGTEQYTCYAQTLTEDLRIDRFEYEASPIVHHFLLARALTPEPEGLADCGDVLFRFSWLPLFGAGKGNARLDLPDDSAMILPKGTQVLLQMHLLNTSPKDATDTPKLRLHKTNDESRTPAGIFAFGTDKISLAPNQTGSASDQCVMDQDVEVFGLLAHMHYLGQSLSLETGSSDSDMTERYRMDPWNFDAQVIEPISLSLKSGEHTRVTCSYDNDTPNTVGFGESSKDEMCFLVGFAKNRTDLDGCLTFSGTPGDAGVPPDPDAGSCGEQQPNADGIGKACTKAGGECGANQTCSADQGDTPGDVPGFCLKIGCGSQADCGGGSATCCAPAEAGGLVKICLPEACRPADCIPAE